MQEETPYIAFLLVNSDRIWFLSLDILSASVALIQKPVNWFAVQSYLHSFVHVLSEAVAWRCSVKKVLSLKVYQIFRNVGKSSIYIWLYQIHRFTFQTTYYWSTYVQLTVHRTSKVSWYKCITYILEQLPFTGETFEHQHIY